MFQSPLRPSASASSSLQSPRKARSPTKSAHKVRHDSTSQLAKAKDDLRDIDAILADYCIERDSRLRTLATNQAERLAALGRKVASAKDSLGEQVRMMRLDDFATTYAFDPSRASRDQLKKSIAPPKPIVHDDLAGRPRKRAAPPSPSRATTSSLRPTLSASKRARSAPTLPTSTSKPRIPSSAARRRAPPSTAAAAFAIPKSPSPADSTSDWDMMDRNEASRADESPVKGKGKAKAKGRDAAGTAPSGKFTYGEEQPDFGREYRKLQSDLVDKMEGTLRERGAEMGAKERQRLEKMLADMRRVLE
ncbi:hypothetical protein RQP46_002352 [Phenoliferia psychrophenolica]